MPSLAKVVLPTGILMAALAVLPMFSSGYHVSFTIQVFMWIALAGSWNIISGLTGYVSFGHVAFFGVGAYTSALLITKAGWHWLPAGLAGCGPAALLALLIGYPCLRLKGPYFAIAMLGLNEVVRALVSYFEGLTGGGSGISLPPINATVPVYYAMGATALAVVVTTYLIINSRFGLRLISIREDEIAAETMGIDTARMKLYAFLISAAFPGIVGGFYAWYASHIEPMGVFPLITTITMIIMCLFGGAGTVLGPVIGATLLSIMQELVWARFLFVHQAIFGALIIGVVLLMPRGILGVARQYFRLPRTV
ncbi:MAG TPA: branched-chain amino acid ABC transporter permease [Hyphomicrobiaceae bacterium]|jgi:branched-chain amino acid transport system permease protein|nr:branched-chain amino acid ABC transporter permease [Hyphomicrobiaceae bacterium]